MPLLPSELPLLFNYATDEKQLLSEFRIDFYEAMDKLNRDKDWSVKKLPRPPKPRAMSEQEYLEKLDDFDKLYEESIPVYQSEWGIHERFVDVMDTIAIPGDFTPFAVPDSVTRLILEAEDEHINNRMSATAAAKRASDRVNEEIDWTLKENPKLLSKYKILCNDQKLIDELRSKGQKVPVSLIRNPFYVKYYREQGWSSDSD